MFRDVTNMSFRSVTKLMLESKLTLYRCMHEELDITIIIVQFMLMKIQS